MAGCLQCRQRRQGRDQIILDQRDVVSHNKSTAQKVEIRIRSHSQIKKNKVTSDIQEDEDGHTAMRVELVREMNLF